MKYGVFAAFAALLLTGIGPTGSSSAATVPVISTIAGGVGGPGPATNVALVTSTISSIGGNLYASGSPVRTVNEATDWLTSNSTIFPAQTDAYGNEMFTDGRLLRILAEHTGRFYGQNMVAGKEYTIAGGGSSAPDGVPALQGSLYDPVANAIDGAGNVVVDDNATVYVVAIKTGHFFGRAMTAGYIYKVSNQTADVVRVDHMGNLVIGDVYNGLGHLPPQLWVVAERSGSMYGYQMTAGVPYPVGSEPYLRSVLIDGQGNALVSNGTLIQVVPPVSGRFYGQDMTAGKQYTIAGGGTSEADGVPALQAFLVAGSLAFDAHGNLLFVQLLNKCELVRLIAATSGTFYAKAMTAGDVYTVAGDGFAAYSGDGGPGTAAQLLAPGFPVLDKAGNLFFGDQRDVSLSPYGRTRVVAGATGTFYGQQMTKGDIYTMQMPPLTAIDAAGNFFTVSASGQVEVLAENTGLYYGQQMTAGNVYPLTSSGVPGVVTSVARNGNLVITNGNEVDVYAATSGNWYGQAMTAGNVYKVAGGGWLVNYSGVPGLDEQLTGLNEGFADPAGNLVLDVKNNNTIQVVAATSGRFYGQSMKSGDIYTIAGVVTPGSAGTPGYSGDGGPAIKAELNNPGNVVVDAAGNLVVADSHNSRIRVIAVKTGTFYSQAMTAGDIYTIAGNGSATFGGDGGPATAAGISFPHWLAVTPTGSIVVIDDNRVRVIS